MDIRGVEAPTLMASIVIGLVILAGVVFAVSQTVFKTDDIECTGGFLECDDDSEEILPPGVQGETDVLKFTINDREVQSSNELIQGEDNIIKISTFQDRICEAAILEDEKLYQENRITISDASSCKNPLTIRFDSLKNSRAQKIELLVVAYKPGLSRLIHDDSAWADSTITRVTIK